MTGPRPHPWRLSRGLVLLLVLAAATGALALALPAARGFLCGGALVLVTLFAGLLIQKIERRTRALEEAYRGALDIMSRLIDTAARYSENHSRRVAESAIEVARALGCDAAEIEDIRIAALLHDLGRLDIPTEALAEAAGLTPAELDEIGHDERRSRRRSGSAGGTLRQIVPMVACCQERWDGTGRRGLEGREIPLGARILAVADAYDGIVTDRAYQRGRTHEEAVTALLGASGTQFDPLVVDVFVRLRGATPAVAAREAKAA